jgi:rare lipoprotein A
MASMGSSIEKIELVAAPKIERFSRQVMDTDAIQSTLEKVDMLNVFEQSQNPLDRPALLPNQYKVRLSDVDETKMIRVVNSWDTGHASVFIDTNEVVRIRSEYQKKTPLLRSKILAYQLSQSLKEDEPLSNITVVVKKKRVNIQSGSQVLLQVDRKTAKAAQTDPVSLAIVWTNQIRDALGETTLTTDETEAIRAQGFNIVAGLLSPSNYQVTGRRLAGLASWYGPGFHGRRTANGSRFNMYALTAAHKSLPFGTKVLVTNRKNGKSCVVEITDRGPYVGPRIIDVSKGAASKLGMLGSGVARVTVDILAPKSK